MKDESLAQRAHPTTANALYTKKVSFTFATVAWRSEIDEVAIHIHSKKKPQPPAWLKHKAKPVTRPLKALVDPPQQPVITVTNRLTRA